MLASFPVLQGGIGSLPSQYGVSYRVLIAGFFFLYSSFLVSKVQEIPFLLLVCWKLFVMSGC